MAIPTAEVVYSDDFDIDDHFGAFSDEFGKVFYHGTASSREASIDERGLLPHASGVEADQVRLIVECFEKLGWSGSRVAGFPVLRAYTIRHDFRDGDRSPLFLSERPSQAILFAMPGAAGGEKLSSCLVAIANLRQFLYDAEFRQSQISSPDSWVKSDFASGVSEALLAEIRGMLESVQVLETKAERERAEFRYAVVYAIRPPAQISAGWAGSCGMGWRVHEPIPPSWFVAKLRVYPPPKG